MNRTIEDFERNANFAKKEFMKNGKFDLVVMMDWMLQLASDVKDQLAKSNSPSSKEK